jgi:hypothetical protein
LSASISVLFYFSANSLFAVPAQDEFVFLESKDYNRASLEDPRSTVSSDVVYQACSRNPSSQLKLAHRSTSGIGTRQLYRSEPDATTYSNTVSKFKKFLLHHIQLAQRKGFEDDSRRVAEHKHFFVRPTFDQWKSAFNVWNDCVFNPVYSDETINLVTNHS